MPCGGRIGGRKFRVKFCDFKACLFGVYFVRNFAEFQSRIYIYAPSIRLISASSKRKNTAPYLGRFALEFYIQI